LWPVQKIVAPNIGFAPVGYRNEFYLLSCYIGGLAIGWATYINAHPVATVAVG
jgi:hypothetical protein